MNYINKKNVLGSIDICGFAIPKDKRLLISLTYIYGVARKGSADIIEELGLDENMRANTLNDEQIHSIREYVRGKEDAGVLGYSLKRKKSLDIAYKKQINCYQGRRLREGLPCRGQNTHSNNKRSKKRSKK